MFKNLLNIAQRILALAINPEKENEYSGLIETLIAGAIGGLCSFIASWMGALPSLPPGYNLATFFAAIFIGAVVGYLFTTFLIGFEKPKMIKVVAVACLCGMLWMPLCGYLPLILGKVFAKIDVSKIMKTTEDSASYITNQKELSASDFIAISTNAINLMRKTNAAEDANTKLVAKSALTKSISALGLKAKTYPDLAAKSLYKIGTSSNQYGFPSITREVENELKKIDGVDKSTIDLMHGELPSIKKETSLDK